jgi:hypothetical protein
VSSSAFVNVPSQDAFVRYDIVETSLHFEINRLDLHIIADAESHRMSTKHIEPFDIVVLSLLMFQSIDLLLTVQFK